MKFKSLILLTLITICLSCEAGESFWDLDSAANQVANSDNLQLISNNGVKHTLSRTFILRFHEIKNSISSKAGIYPKVLISDSQEINAYATWQNGQPVTIFTLGILDKLGNDTDALAAVVGHEISHLTLQHAKSSQNAGILVDLLAGLAMIAIDSSYGGAAYNPYRGLYKTGLDLASNLTLAAYSRNEELEADEQGVRYMLAAGFSAEGAIRVQEQIIPSNSSFFSTHPSSGSRVEKIRLAALNFTGNEIRPQPYQIATYEAKTVANTKSNTYVDDSKYSAYTQICLDRGLNPNSSLFDACVFNAKRELEEKAKIANNAKNLPYRGQVGSIVSVNTNPKYVIFSSTIPTTIPVGTKITIGNDTSITRAEVSKGYDGYYLIELTEETNINQGDRVFLDN